MQDELRAARSDPLHAHVLALGHGVEPHTRMRLRDGDEPSRLARRDREEPREELQPRRVVDDLGGRTLAGRVV